MGAMTSMMAPSCGSRGWAGGTLDWWPKARPRCGSTWSCVARSQTSPSAHPRASGYPQLAEWGRDALSRRRRDRCQVRVVWVRRRRRREERHEVRADRGHTLVVAEEVAAGGRCVLKVERAEHVALGPVCRLGAIGGRVAVDEPLV